MSLKEMEILFEEKTQLKKTTLDPTTKNQIEAEFRKKIIELGEKDEVNTL